MTDVSAINKFFQGQKKIQHTDLEAIREFITMIKRGFKGVPPIKVMASEAGGISISLEDQDERTDFALDKADSLSETGIIVPTFAGSTGLDENGNVLGEEPGQTYTGAWWTFINSGGESDGDNDTITSAIDTSKPFVAEVAGSVVSGDWVGVQSGSTLLQKDFPGFRVLANTSALTGTNSALIVRRPVDGMLAKAKASISEGSSGNVILSETDGTEQGGEFAATNKGSDVVSGDFVQLGEDAKGAVFFKPTKSGGTCGDGDCPDSCVNLFLCFEVFWIQNGDSGSFFIAVEIQSGCVQFFDPVFNPFGDGTIQDPVTGKDWDLMVEWDICGQVLIYTLSDCDGNPVNIDPDFGDSIASACGSDIDIFIQPAGSQPCSTSNDFPCCDDADGCTCP